MAKSKAPQATPCEECGADTWGFKYYWPPTQKTKKAALCITHYNKRLAPQHRKPGRKREPV